MTIATLIGICGFLPHQHIPLTIECASAVQQLVCSVPEAEIISDDDPALPIFWDEGERIEDAKVDLAIERANGCEDER